jgi:hypothetical protein
VPRGGKRQGTQGKGYSNRTDLGMDYAAGGNPATGGQEAPQQQRQFVPPAIGADQVPNIGDPTARPNEPVTAGLQSGLGPGPEAMPPMPPSPTDPIRQVIQAMLMMQPNPDLVRVLNRLTYEGR